MKPCEKKGGKKKGGREGESMNLGILQWGNLEPSDTWIIGVSGQQAKAVTENYQKK